MSELGPRQKHVGPWKVRFKGREWILMDGDDGGALTTQSLFSAGEASYAHVFPPTIMRFGAVIGTTADLEWIEAARLEAPDPDEFDRNIDGPTWSPKTIDV